MIYFDKVIEENKDLIEFNKNGMTFVLLNHKQIKKL